MHHLVVNPIAGRGRGLPLVERAVAGLEAAGLAVAVHRTERPGHATAIVDALEADAVPVAFGGDGTVHEVMVACLRRDLPLGILPVGSGDDFAFAIDLGRLDFDAALRVLVEGNERHVDVGTVDVGTVDVGDVDMGAVGVDGVGGGDRGGEPFVNSFGTGFDADVARRIVHAPTYYRGLGKYLYGIVTAMRDFRVLEVEVSVDGREVFAGPSLLVAVQNGPRTGGSFLFAPEAAPDDGLLDVVIAGGFGRLGTLGILPRVMRGRHVGHPRIQIHRGRRARLRWSAPVAGHTEGEVLGLGTDYDVTLVPASLRVIAPRRAMASAPAAAERTIAEDRPSGDETPTAA